MLTKFRRKRRPKFNPTHKTVEYAYPTSTNAKKAGFHDEGCWCFHLLDSAREYQGKLIAGYAKREDAITRAEQSSLPWSPIFLAANPQEKRPLSRQAH